jgi:transcriptional antiterminator RfaH
MSDTVVPNSPPKRKKGTKNCLDGQALWFAIRTKPDLEQFTLRNFLDLGFIAYLPLIEVTRRTYRHVDQVHRPVFPGVLFLHLPPSRRDWPVIRSVVGAIGPVTFDDNHPAVPDWVINRLRDGENERGLISLAHIQTQFTQCPPMMSAKHGGLPCQGVFRFLRGEDRVKTLLEILCHHSHAGNRNAKCHVKNAPL